MRIVTPNGDAAEVEAASPILSMLLGLVAAEKAGQLSGLVIIGTLAQEPGQVIWKVEGMDTFEAVARLEFVKAALLIAKLVPRGTSPEEAA